LPKHIPGAALTVSAKHAKSKAEIAMCRAIVNRRKSA